MKHLLSLYDLTTEEIESILELAIKLKADNKAGRQQVFHKDKSIL